MTEKEWQRPKKPYVVTPDQNGRAAYTGGNQSTGYPKKDFKPKAKPIITPQKNNANNKLLHVAMQEGARVRVTINNLLSSDKELEPVYEGLIRSFDDFSVAVETGNGFFNINKSSIAVVEFKKPDGGN